MSSRARFFVVLLGTVPLALIGTLLYKHVWSADVVGYPVVTGILVVVYAAAAPMWIGHGGVSRPSPPVEVTRRGLMTMGGIVGIGFALVLIAGVFFGLKLGKLVTDNRDAIARIHRIEQPSDAQILAGVAKALQAIRSCARSRECRRRNPQVSRAARLIPRGDLPRPRRKARRRRTTSSSGGGGTTSGGNGTTTAPSPSRRPQGPTQTGSRPQPTRPPAPPRPPANTPASPPASPPAAQNPPAPTPQSPRPPPAVTTPPVGPVPPQTTPNIPLPPVPPLPPLPGVCTPVIGVNCPKAP